MQKMHFLFFCIKILLTAGNVYVLEQGKVLKVTKHGV